MRIHALPSGSGRPKGLREAPDGRAVGYLVEAAYLLWDAGVGRRDAITGDFKSNRLTRVTFADAESETTAIWAVCPTISFVPPKGCVFIGKLVNALSKNQERSHLMSCVGNLPRAREYPSSAGSAGPATVPSPAPIS